MRGGGRRLIGETLRRRDPGDYEVVLMLHEVGLREAVKIKRMRVDPTYGRRGYGRAILAALERRAAEWGFDTLHLATGAPQESARHLYEGSGYREVRRGMVGPIKSIFCEKNLA